MSETRNSQSEENLQKKVQRKGHKKVKKKIIGVEVEEESESTESTPLKKLKQKVAKKKPETELSVEEKMKATK